MKKYWAFFFVVIGSYSLFSQRTDLYSLPTFLGQDRINAVIEIPAGTNMKIEFEPSAKKFEVDTNNGIERKIDFLPYPANYGFIPGTSAAKSEGGDGDALDILVLSESEETGTIMEVRPIAMLKLLDKGEQDFKIIAVPENPNRRIVSVETYKEFLEHYPAIIDIIELWFLNYNKNDITQVKEWVDERAAMKEIKHAAKK